MISEVRILKGLEGEIAEVRIPKDLEVTAMVPVAEAGPRSLRSGHAGLEAEKLAARSIRTLPKKMNQEVGR